MLLSLKIENYALIKSCFIDFNKGFTCITGETGAGKSILLGALSLVLGHRADLKVLADKNAKCIVEAVFSIDEDMRSVFDDNDLDFESQSVFRREITPTGKSRAFINDTPVQQSVMKIFAQTLVDIHSQSSTIELKEEYYQLAVVDSLLADQTDKQTFCNLYEQYKSLQKEITSLQTDRIELQKERDYNEYLFNELQQADIQPDEQQTNERLSELYANGEKIKENISESLSILDNESDNNVLGMLNETNYRLQKIASHNELLASLYKRMESASIEMKDIYQELASFNDTLDFNKEDMDKVSDRLNLIYSLERKHNVNTTEELLQIKNDLEDKLQLSDDLDGVIADKRIQLNEITERLRSAGERLHGQRVAAAEHIVKSVKPLLASMAMKDAMLGIEVKKTDDIFADGMDKVCFMFNANRTENDELMPLSHVISGGEMSRLMLAIKAVVAKKTSMPTMIFDEIDTGISGDIASKTADIMKDMSVGHQIIAVTHLVQMAAKADYQYKVYKTTVGNHTQSNITLLSDQERIKEIAGMLSGDVVTKEATANAKRLLSID